VIAQIARISATSLQALPQRWGASLVVVLGMAGVIGVMVSLLAMAEGFRQTFSTAGSPNRVIVVQNAEDTGTTSAITREQLPVVMDLPGFARDTDGRPVAVGLKFMTSELRERKTGNGVGVMLRGVTDKAWRLWPEVKIVEGRAFTAGRREVVIGRTAQREFAGTELGAEVELTNGPWTIVGVFEAPGTLFEAEMWGDVEMVFPGFSVTGHYSSVIGELASPDAFRTLSDAITSNPRLKHIVRTEADYYATLSGNLGSAMVLFGYVVAGIMGLGALFSAVNTMYAAVKARSREIATLRAIGFGGLPVVCSVLLESVALCAAGAVLGGLLAYLLFNGNSMSTLSGGQDLRQIVFAFHVTGSLLAQGVVVACAIGLLGGLFPAIRAARLPVAEALRRA
jgi:putative ABC transport system permease protein